MGSQDSAFKAGQKVWVLTGAETVSTLDILETEVTTPHRRGVEVVNDDGVMYVANSSVFWSRDAATKKAYIIRDIEVRRLRKKIDKLLEMEF